MDNKLLIKPEIMDFSQDEIKNLLEVMEPYILSEMNYTFMIKHMDCITVKYLSAICEIEDRAAGNGMMLAWLKKNANKEIFQKFLDGLKEEKMDKLYKRLTFEEVKDKPIFREIVFQNIEHIKRIRFGEAISYLYKEKYIEMLEQNELCEFEKHYGNSKAMVELVCHLSITRDDWFPSLIKCLKELKEKVALKALSPLLLTAKSDESLQIVIDNLGEKEVFSDELLSSLSNKREDNEIFLNYARKCIHQLLLIGIEPLCDKLLALKAINLDELEKINSKKKSHMIRVFELIMHIGRKKGGFFYLIKSLIICREKGALHALDFTVEDTDEIIKNKLKRLKKCSSDDSYKADDLDSIDVEKKRAQQAAKQADSESSSLEVDGAIGFGDGKKTNDTEQCEKHSSEIVENVPSLYDLTEDDSPSENDYPEREPESTQYDFRTDEELQEQERQPAISRPVEDTNLIPNQIKVSGFQLNFSEQDVLQAFDSVSNFIEENPVSKLKKIKKISEKEAIITFTNPDMAGFVLGAFKGGKYDLAIVEETVTKNVEESSSAASTFQNPSRGSSTASTFQNPSRGSSSSPVKKSDINLRSYQEELAENAVKGQNCIICAPTGSGKTLVAVHIIKDHLRKNKANKVIFIVPNVALVEQQKKQVEIYSDESTRVCGMSGGNEISLESLIDSFEVFVLTPQILDNYLSTDVEFLHQLTLMIFDECHHTNKEHPYNSIMIKYLKLKHEKINDPLPQVVGLTASIGVGKSKNLKEAIEYVTTICSNLDCPTLCTVNKNISELTKHMNKPKEDVVEVRGREFDPFRDELNTIMHWIEKKMQGSKEKIRADEELGNFSKDLKPPSERGCDPYTQWLSRMKKSICQIHHQDTRMFFVICVDFLMMYNNSLLINADCRTKDAIEYIENKLKEDEYLATLVNPTVMEELFQQWRDTHAKLKMFIDDRKCENPKLNVIKNMLTDCFDKEPDSRCIIFCKTREMTVALVNWMNETPGLKSLMPTKLVGSNAPANRAGMTNVQQDDVLKFFKGGQHKIIIATSVAEEGLDVQKCNLVIRYEHVTDIVARVQTRGRARQENAEYVVVAERGKGAATKEGLNEIREKMMKKAIEQFQSLGMQERRHKIHENQKEALIEKKLADVGAKYSQSLKKKYQGEQDYEIRCLKCDQFAAMSSDIRKIEESHHVVMDTTIKDRVDIRAHPRAKIVSLNFELTGKIYCKRCSSDWGIMALYKRVPFPVIKISSFVLKSGIDQKNYKQWKSVPFEVRKLTVDDLEAAVTTNTDVYSESTALSMSLSSRSASSNWNEMQIDEDLYNSDS